MNKVKRYKLFVKIIIWNNYLEQKLIIVGNTVSSGITSSYTASFSVHIEPACLLANL